MTEEEYRARTQNDVLIRRVRGVVADLSDARTPRRHDAKADQYRHEDNSCSMASWCHDVSLRSRPVISFGGSIPSSCKIVGPTSRSEPPARRAPSCFGAPAPTITSGTGLVVWAVWGPPVAGSIISSQLPGSEVQIPVPPPSSGVLQPTPRP